MSKKLTNEEKDEHQLWHFKNSTHVWKRKGVSYCIHLLTSKAAVKIGDVWHRAVHYRRLDADAELYTRTREEFEKEFTKSSETVEAYYKRISS